jgi:hypothetical protein
LISNCFADLLFNFAGYLICLAAYLVLIHFYTPAFRFGVRFLSA